MNISQLCLNRPVATSLLWLSVIITGAIAWFHLPIAALPRYETPVIEVKGRMPGASPENMAASIATPLEKEFSSIPGLINSTSENIQGETDIRLEFSARRDIDSAAADVQAALFRVSRSLPSEMTSPPSYSKVNPGDAPILKMGISSPTMSLSELNAYIDELVIPALSTVDGVAQVTAKGRKRYAVRVHIDPARLAALDLTLLDVSQALKAANANTALGQLDGERQMLMVQMPGELLRASDFAKIIITARDGQGIRLSDIADVRDSIENIQDTRELNGVNSVILDIRRQHGANTVRTVDNIKALLPRLHEQLPGSVEIVTMGDRSLSVREAIHDVNLTLLLTIALVIMVIALFLRRFTSALIPSISLPVSLLGTFALMQALDLSLNNISLMGMTIAVGLVVDDAIVVLENVMRHVENGMRPFEAAMRGAKEVSFTVISISVSLVAVFIPIFFMPGTAGLLFHEFAIVVSLAILVSAAVALTLIPVLVPMLMGREKAHAPVSSSGWNRWFERLFEWTLARYRRGLDWSLTHPRTILAAGLMTFALTAILYITSPRSFFPAEDIGQISVKIKTPPEMSYEGRLAVLRQIQQVVLQDDAIAASSSKVDNDSTKIDIDLKPRHQRPPMGEILARMRASTQFIPGVKVNFSPVQNLKIGASSSDSTWQYTLQSVGSEHLDEWSERLLAAMRQFDVFVGLDTDFEKDGLQAQIHLDRDKMALLGVDMAELRTTLHTAFGGREVSSIHAPQATYKVIMELEDQYRRDETDLSRIHVRSRSGGMVPLSAFAGINRSSGTMTVLHKMQLPAITFSFELAPGKSLSDAAAAIDEAKRQIGLPATVFGSFDGQGAVFEQSQTSQVWLILLAVAVIYVVLGVLYESWIHPLTILMGIPSAAVGAFVALRLTGLDISFIAMIGVLLLIGIVKKNAIMMIDFALDAQRNRGISAREAIQQACLLRFRPIMMTTLCAMMGAIPIALGLGAGAELRQPMGVVIVGGLLFSQVMTLFITPVVYLWFERLFARQGDKSPQPARLDGNPVMAEGAG